MSAGPDARRRFRGAPRAAALLAAAALVATTALAQSAGGSFELRASAIANGGGRASGGTHALEGTVGQHDAGAVLAGGSFQLTGGLHRRAAAAPGAELLSDGFE